MRPRRAVHDQSLGRFGSIAILLALLLVVGNLTFAQRDSSATQTQCPDGEVLSSNGVTCEVDPTYQPPCPEGEMLDPTGLRCEPIPSDSPCPVGERLDAAGLKCIPDVPPDTSPCPAGEILDEAGIRCVVDVTTIPQESVCEPGFQVAADGVTCLATGPTCPSGQVLGNDGTCRATFSCAEGLILTSDLLSCVSSRCPDGELLSVDGTRCVAKDTKCPDGSPRPVGGACLVVEITENADGTRVVTVRCDPADLFCQALINECAEQKAAGSETADADCEDPRTSCPEGDDECEEANARLVDCATVDVDDTETEAGDIRDRRNPCDELCPRLHALDASGECVEFLDPTHPCVSFGRVPAGVTTNQELDRYSFLAGTGQCVTRVEFLRRLANFEGAAGAELDALELLRATTSKYLSVEEQLAELQLQLVIGEKAVTNFTVAAAEADLERNANQKLLVETRKQLQRERELLRAEVLEVFTRGGNDAAVAKAVLSSATITEIGVSRVYGRALLNDQIRILERVTDLEIETEALGQALELAAAEVERSLASAVEATEEIARLLDQAGRLQVEQLARRDEEAALVSVLREDKAEFAQELGIFDQASREIADIIAESEFLVTEFEDFDGLLATPVIPGVMSSGFGPRLHPILGYVRNHDGVDFTIGFGEPIYASAPGVVQIASTFGGYGQTVVLDHGAGLLTLYAHMSTIAVESGDLVERGDVVGLVGSTGLSTGPHLHFEVWVGGNTAVDPRPYLDLE